MPYFTNTRNAYYVLRFMYKKISWWIKQIFSLCDCIRLEKMKRHKTPWAPRWHQRFSERSGQINMTVISIKSRQSVVNSLIVLHRTARNFIYSDNLLCKWFMCIIQEKVPLNNLFLKAIFTKISNGLLGNCEGLQINLEQEKLW